MKRFIGGLLFSFAVFGLSAEDLGSTTLGGKLDASFNAVSSGNSNDWSYWGLTTGRFGLTMGTKDVKTEVRAQFQSIPVFSWSVDRAWVKFRLDGFRGILGRGRVAWGPGFVYDVADLLFDSTQIAVNFANDELRSDSAWLGDALVGLGEEAFAEITLKADDQGRVPAGGVRISEALGDLSYDVAYAADGSKRLHSLALSTQFHIGLDWYGALRMDVPFVLQPDFSVAQNLSSSFGFFTTVDFGEGFGMTIRQEGFLPKGANGREIESYHEVAFTFPEDVTIVIRDLVRWTDPSTLVMSEVDWNPLQAFRIYTRAAFQLGATGATFSSTGNAPVALSFGVVTTF